MTDELDGITIRSTSEATFKADIRPLPYAFLEEWPEAAVEIDRAVAEYDRLFVALEGETSVGFAGAYTFSMTVPGGAQVGTAGVTMVGVMPTHRRRGILRALMRRTFDQALERGEPLAMLWASEAAIYQRFGYGLATFQNEFEAQVDKIRFVRPIESRGRVRIVDVDEAMRLIPPIFEVRRATTVGSLTRTDAKWRTQLLADAEWMRNGNGLKVLAVLEVDGEPRAYAIYRNKSDWDNTGPKGVVIVIELMGLDPDAEQELWQWVFGIDLVGVVRAWRGPVPHPLELMITEPRRLGPVVRDANWLRILDLPAALAARTYRGPGSLVLEVTDDFCPPNAGRWELTVAPDGVGSVETTKAEPDLIVDIRDIAAVYLGTYRFSDLARANRVRECRLGALAAADGLFATATAPFNSTMF